MISVVFIWKGEGDIEKMYKLIYKTNTSFGLFLFNITMNCQCWK